MNVEEPTGESYYAVKSVSFTGVLYDKCVSLDSNLRITAAEYTRYEPGSYCVKLPSEKACLDYLSYYDREPEHNQSPGPDNPVLCIMMLGNKFFLGSHVVRYRYTPVRNLFKGTVPTNWCKVEIRGSNALKGLKNSYDLVVYGVYNAVKRVIKDYRLYVGDDHLDCDHEEWFVQVHLQSYPFFRDLDHYTAKWRVGTSHFKEPPAGSVWSKLLDAMVRLGSLGMRANFRRISDRE